jgi:lipopolysaccharide/colanic/teichoic acid biosynthesis glycosyltransferase
LGFYQLFGKRLLDAAAGAAGVAATWPVLAGAALLVKLDSKGPVFYRGTRVGKDGKPFRILKFRTMVENAERMGPLNVGDTDDRVTRVGRVLRTTKLDELPQLLSVLKGDMSLVGPRPDVPEYAALYSEGEREKILSLVPGVTDWASITHFDQYADFAAAEDPDAMFVRRIRPLKVKLQLHYAERASLSEDLRILAWTARRMLLREKTLPPEIRAIVDAWRAVQDEKGAANP